MKWVKIDDSSGTEDTFAMELPHGILIEVAEQRGIALTFIPDCRLDPIDRTDRYEVKIPSRARLERKG